MKIKFKKDYKDPRPNRSKVIKAGKEISCSRVFGEKAIKDGYATELEAVNILEEIEKSKK